MIATLPNLDAPPPQMHGPRTFCILGAAGFVAPRHMEAIRKIGGRIVAACDPSGAVGVLDRYAPDCRFFLYFEQFLSWLARERETHYVVVATPNDFHVGQAKAVQEFGHVPIIEKPVGLTVADASTLLGAPSVAVLQMRLHPEARRLIEWGRAIDGDESAQVTYNAPRGEWYGQVWKGDDRRSGGVATNIGIHVLDLLVQSFGDVHDATSAVVNGERVYCVGLQRAHVLCRFTTDAKQDERRTVVLNGGREFNFSSAFGLHDEFYRRLARGDFPTVEDALPSIALAERLR